MNNRDIALNENVSVLEVPYNPGLDMGGVKIVRDGKAYYTLLSELVPRKLRNEPKMLRLTVIPYGQKPVWAGTMTGEEEISRTTSGVSKYGTRKAMKI